MNTVCGKSLSFYRFLLFVSAILLFISTSTTFSSMELNELLGLWQCQEEGQSSTLEFQSKNRLLYNGEPANYTLAPGVIRLETEYGPVDYRYTLEGNKLLIFDPNGLLTQCQRAVEMPQSGQPSRHVQPDHPVRPNREIWPQYSKPTPPPGVSPGTVRFRSGKDRGD